MHGVQQNSYDEAETGGDWNRRTFLRSAGGNGAGDLPDAEIHLLDAGLFAMHETNDEIAELMLRFLPPNTNR